MSSVNSILIIDDDEQVRRALINVFEGEGFLIKAVEKGKKAIEVLSNSTFDVALIDIKLPDIDGIELLKRMKEKETGPKMVKIIMTGFPSLDNAIEAVNKGADAYILKPVDTWKLLKTIEKLLRERYDDYLLKHVSQWKKPF
jgi:two-component system NtrC family response regulator